MEIENANWFRVRDWVSARVRVRARLSALRNGGHEPWHAVYRFYVKQKSVILI